MKQEFRHKIIESVREIVFGTEDALVSTLGAITGIAAGTQSTYIVILSGIVLIAVEATSMATGSYLSSRTVAQAQTVVAKDHGCLNVHYKTSSMRGAVIMFVSYVVGGIFPLLPYFFLPIKSSYLPSILLTVIILFVLGVFVSRLTKRSSLKAGLEMVAISLSAAVIGYLIGRLVSMFFGVEITV